MRYPECQPGVTHLVGPTVVWRPTERIRRLMVAMSARPQPESTVRHSTHIATHVPEIAQIVQQDIADAKALKVTPTPEFFVNSKPMPSFGREQLTALVNDAVAKAYPQ